VEKKNCQWADFFVVQGCMYNYVSRSVSYVQVLIGTCRVLLFDMVSGSPNIHEK